MAGRVEAGTTINESAPGSPFTFSFHKMLFNKPIAGAGFYFNFHVALAANFLR
jgi:hypothetical protein